MKLPNINLEELEKSKEENRRQRMEFIKEYVIWLKKTSNEEWSSQRRNFTDKNQ